MDRAVEALGGPNYLNVQTVVGKVFTPPYRDGMSQIPANSSITFAFPDRERTEFIGAGFSTIQTNSGDTGWLFDGAVKKISDQTPAQVEDFKRAMRTSSRIFCVAGGRRKAGKVTYVGRREAGSRETQRSDSTNLS